MTTSNANSAKEGEPISVWGPGNETCGDYLSVRQNRDNNSYDGEIAALFFSYYLGLRTGHNLATTGAQSRGEISQATVIAYLDNYCRTHALKPLLGGYRCLLQSSGVKYKYKITSCE